MENSELNTKNVFRFADPGCELQYVVGQIHYIGYIIYRCCRACMYFCFFATDTLFGE